MAVADNFNSLFEFLPIGAYRSLPNGTQLRANPALVRLNGYANEAEMLAAVHDIGREWYVDPARREQFRLQLERDGHVKAFVSEVYRHKDRECIWVSENAHLVRDDQGAALYYEGTVEDITERVRAEAELRSSEERWKLALESAGDAVWDWNLQSGQESLSNHGLEMYGYAPGELATTPDALDRRTHPDDVPQMLLDRQAHLEGRSPSYVNEHRVQCKDGSWKWILSRGMVIARDAQGRPLRMIGTHTDITARKQAEALRREVDRAESATRATTQFLSHVSHELRTPLNAILGFAQLLQLEPSVAARQRAWVEQILGSGRHLLALVEDILQLSSVQTGQLRFDHEPVALRALVEEAWTMQAQAAQQTHVVWRNDVPDEPAVAVHADRRRLLQVASNLLSNAVKYNRPGGGVRVSAQRTASTVELAVQDTGLGLTAEQLERLFTPFDRLGAEHTRVAGSGLGLALSQQLVQAMGGTLRVRSEAGVGSTFVVALPAAQP